MTETMKHILLEKEVGEVQSSNALAAGQLPQTKIECV